MRVLFVSHSGKRRGGAQNVLFDLMRSLPKDRFECQCVFPEYGEFFDEVQAYGIKSHKVGFQWWAGFEMDTLYKIPGCLLNIRRSVDPIAEIIVNEKIDLVVSNTVAMCEGALAARITMVPHVWYVHEILSRDPKMKHMIRLDFLYHVMLQMSERLVVVSNAVREEIEQHIGGRTDKVVVIHNGVPHGRKDFVRSREPNVISVGGICRRKGQKVLMEAAQVVCDQIPEARFFVAGKFWEREYRQELLDLRVEKGLVGKFHFLKWVADIDALYRSGAMLVSTATCESFGLVLLEAMSCGLPVITTDSGGPSEIVTDGETGYVVPVDDSTAVAMNIIHLLRHPEVADGMGLKGYLRAVACFSQERAVNRFAGVLEDVLQPRREAHVGHA